MKSAMMVKYKDLSLENQEAVARSIRESDLEARARLIKSHGEEVADNCWWSKLDYINSRKVNPDLYVHVCPVCGVTDKEMKVLSDKQSGLSRSVTCRCKCGETLHYYG